MPIFDYKCEACGHAFDVLQKAGEGPLRKCPECGKLKLKKQLAAPNFHLKGSGWYKTDFKDGPARKTPEGKSTDKSEGKTEGKTEAKADGDKKGHSLDTTPEKKHDHKHDHKHGHDHSHGGHSHSHGPGGHKH